MRKKKLIISTAFLIGLLATVGGAFSAYILTNDINEKVMVDSNDINVVEKKQNFLKYTGIAKNILLYDTDIVSDVFSIGFSINQTEFVKDNRLASNSGIKLEIVFGSLSLFDHVKNDVKNEFIDVTYGIDYKLAMEYGKVYTSDGQNCLEFNNDNNKCTFRIPFTSEKSGGSDFYLYKIAIDNSLTSNMPVNFEWSFNINLNFNIVDDFYGYSQLFNSSTFGNVSISLIFEEF